MISRELRKTETERTHQKTCSGCRYRHGFRETMIDGGEGKRQRPRKDIKLFWKNLGHRSSSRIIISESYSIND